MIAVVVGWLFVVTAALSFAITTMLIDRGTLEKTEPQPAREFVLIVQKAPVVLGFPPPLPDRNPRRRH